MSNLAGKTAVWCSINWFENKINKMLIICFTVIIYHISNDIQFTYSNQQFTYSNFALCRFFMSLSYSGWSMVYAALRVCEWGFSKHFQFLSQKRSQSYWFAVLQILPFSLCKYSYHITYGASSPFQLRFFILSRRKTEINGSFSLTCVWLWFHLEHFSYKAFSSSARGLRLKTWTALSPTRMFDTAFALYSSLTVLALVNITAVGWTLQTVR